MPYQLPDWEGRAPPPPAALPPLTIFTPSTQPHKLSFMARHTRFLSQPAITKETPPTLPSKYPRSTIRERFNRIFPPHRTYFGYSRRMFLIALLALLICILALILGLAIGLGRRNNSPSYLPLPPSTTPQTGDLTYYDTGLGACGITSSSTDLICAVSHLLYDAAQSPSSTNPNTNPLCGRSIRVTRYDDSIGANRSVDVVVVDRCVGCLAVDLDLSYAAFDRVAERDLGRVKGTWAWLP